MEKTQVSRLSGQCQRNLCSSCVSPPILNFLYMVLVCLCFWTTAVNADEAGERPVYVINYGDHLLISVVGHEKNLTTVAVVRPDGMVTYPVIGDVKAAGLTIVQLSAAISKKLSEKEFYQNPQVTVQLQTIRQESVYVIGDVENPGQNLFPRSVSVVEALAAAGGFRDTADLASARIIKRRKEIIPVDLRILLEDHGGDRLLDNRFMLGDGDVLIVPSAIRAERINVIGHVTMPGQYPVKSSVNLIEALALAGGPVRPAADLKNIRIIKPDGTVIVADATLIWSKNSPRQTESAIEPLTHYVNPGDSVVVLGKGKINILGEVKNQGQFDVDGEIGILEALALAGIQEGSNLEKLRVIRNTGERFTVDVSRIWEKREPKAEITLMSGDTLIVSTVFKINWNIVFTGIVVLSGLYATFVR